MPAACAFRFLVLELNRLLAVFPEVPAAKLAPPTFLSEQASRRLLLDQKPNVLAHTNH
jgi:hypothetical protein